MRTVLIFCLLTLVVYASHAQEIGPRLTVNKSAVDIKNHKIRLTCSIINGQNKTRFYKPNSYHDFCLRLNRLVLNDVSNKAETDYFPCNSLADMNIIHIDDTNSVELTPNSAYTFDLILNASKFDNKLKVNHKYKVSFTINHRDICGGAPCVVFIGFLEANKYQFIYK